MLRRYNHIQGHVHIIFKRVFQREREIALNILFVYYVPSGGVETLARQRALALKPHGITFHYLYFQDGNGRQNLQNEKVFITKDREQVSHILEEGRYDLVIVCSDFLWTRTIRELGYTGPLLYECQGLGNFETAKHWLTVAKPILEKHASGILIPKTPHLERIVTELYEHTPIFAFHNCLDTTTFSYKDTRMFHKTPIIGWVGRIEGNKNWTEFLAIVRLLKRSKQNIRIWMFEDPSLSQEAERRQFEALLDIYRLRDSCTFFSNVSHHEMPRYYSQIADSGGFLCSTSKVEGFGYAVLEAMSCSCPVLVTNSDGVQAFVTHNRTGKMYPLGDVRKAVEEATHILDDTLFRERIRKTGEQFIRNVFSPEKYAQHFQNMVHDLL